VEECLRRARRGSGRVFLSVPLSPNDHEHLVFDPILYPPHHLTRWTLPSISALGERVGAEITITALEPRSAIRRYSHACFCYLKARGRKQGLMHRLGWGVLEPATAWREIAWQFRRGFGNSRLSNHVLIELSHARNP
jgi:hypothetical protein